MASLGVMYIFRVILIIQYKTNIKPISNLFVKGDGYTLLCCSCGLRSMDVDMGHDSTH